MLGDVIPERDAVLEVLDFLDFLDFLEVLELSHKYCFLSSFSTFSEEGGGWIHGPHYPV